MDEDPFAVGRGIITKANNMGANGLWAPDNVKTLLIWNIVKVIGKASHKQAMDASPQGMQLATLTSEYRTRLAEVLEDFHLSHLVTGEDVAQGWEKLKESGTFAHMEWRFTDASVRYNVLPMNIEVSCLPANVDDMEKNLNHVAFEAWVEEQVKTMIADTGLSSLKPTVDGEKMSLRAYLTRYQSELVDKVSEFLGSFIRQQ